MKKILALSLMLVVLLNCTNETQIEKANRSQLTMFLSTNLVYNNFINAHFDNIVSLANLDDGQSKAINDLSKSVNENTDLTTVREKSKKIYEISGMNPEAIEFYFSFTKDLKKQIQVRSKRLS